MPIKLPKGFQRRKSSGNALEEVRNPPETSFRVFERPQSSGKSFDGGQLMKSPVGAAQTRARTNSFDQDEEFLFSVSRPDVNNRGSGGTENSISTAASSTRLSSSSTNPSSLDNRSETNFQFPGQKPISDIPSPPTPTAARGGFLRNTARTFSFGVGNKSQPHLPTSPDNTPALPPLPRDRAVTSSSASTATPPRLFDSDLALENSELDGFGNMFDDIGRRSSREPSPNRQKLNNANNNGISSPQTMYSPSSYPVQDSQVSNRAPPPRPIFVNTAAQIESSPYSWTSQNSHDELMRSPSPSKTITQSGTPPKPLPPITGAQSPSTPPTSQKVVSRKPIARGKENLRPEPSQFGQSSTRRLSPEESEQLDPSLAANAEIAALYQEGNTTTPKPTPVKKVMTPAQFERYKQEQEKDRRLGIRSNDSDSEEDDADNYEDDDDLERDKQAAKQRRKQEAHLAVYRQTMMKVTGEQANGRPVNNMGSPPGQSANNSSVDVSNRLSSLTLDPKVMPEEDEDEDEDVPLGILAAHGFPNKNRPPQRLGESSSNPNLRALSQAQSQYAQSVAGDAAKRGSLPVFARHLPQDPYYGASLVNQANRESLAMHSGAATAHPHHPAGLVGVIAGEERARAMRRGSPSAGFDMPPPHPGMVRSQTTGSFNGMSYPGQMPGMPGMPPMLTPGDQAQIQMSQQMQQMMQMQMQWMQQMSQMMGGQQPNNGPMPFAGQMNQSTPNLLGPSGPSTRPQTMLLNPSPNAGPGLGQRTMSTLNPTMAPWNSSASMIGGGNMNGNYAQSIAPSERSNIGLAPRYRPVSVAPDPELVSTKRSSTFTSSTFRPWSQFGRPMSHAPKASLTPTINLVHDEDDDEQGWAEMKMKKEKKQRTWKLRKGQNPLQDLYPNDQ